MPGDPAVKAWARPSLWKIKQNCGKTWPEKAGDQPRQKLTPVLNRFSSCGTDQLDYLILLGSITAEIPNTKCF
jgi:hypothetical protein